MLAKQHQNMTCAKDRLHPSEGSDDPWRTSLFGDVSFSTPRFHIGSTALTTTTVFNSCPLCIQPCAHVVSTASTTTTITFNLSIGSMKAGNNQWAYTITNIQGDL